MRSELRAFVHQWAGDITVTDDMGLFSQRILRSVHLPQLIILLERLRHAPVDVEHLNLGDLDSIDIIIERFGGSS